MAILQIPISKGKDLYIEVNTDVIDDLPPDVYKEILFQGFKQVLNRGMSGEGLTSSKQLQGKALEDNNAALLEVAEANLEKCKAGEIRVTGGKAKAKGASNKALTTEAMRLARLYVKDAIKRAGKKVSLISGKEITIAAKQLLESDENGTEVWSEAEANLRERQEKEKSIKIDVSGLVEDEALKAAQEAKKKPKVIRGPVPPTRARPEMRTQH